jgi:hypothetical protein
MNVPNPKNLPAQPLKMQKSIRERIYEEIRDQIT